MELPAIVGEEEWQRSQQALLAKENQATRARDALAAERRRKPIMEFSADGAVLSVSGVITMANLVGLV